MSEQEVVLFLSAAGYDTWVSRTVRGCVVVKIGQHCATLYCDLATPTIYLPKFPWSSTALDFHDLLTLLGDP